MASLEEQITQLQQAIATQESLRPTLGDTVVDLTIATLTEKLDSLKAQQKEAPACAVLTAPEELLAKIQSYIPKELAEKIRAIGRIENERRQVTVMFADLSGFTALSDRLDPEEVMEIVNAALKEWAEAVYEYEGYIDKFIGDAIMAVFGAPIAHEDDPERALRSALSMRERLESFNRRWIDRLEQPLSFHIGINTGTVIAGSVGTDSRLSYTVMGDAVNVASRLESSADSGQILVSKETYRLTSEAFTFQILDPITVKGKQEPLAVFELLRAKINPGKSRGLKGLTAKMVGRDREFNQLREVLQELEAGKGRIVIISGEAGLGKSRLMAEWRSLIGNRAIWLEGRCFSHTTSLAYSAFLDLFRRYAGIKDEDSEEIARQRLQSAIAEVFPDNKQAFAIFANLLALRLSPEEAALLASFSAESLRQKLEGLIEEFLTSPPTPLLPGEGSPTPTPTPTLTPPFPRREGGLGGLGHPTVLVIEDMHWADLTSVELVERLLPLTGKIPLAIICVFRRQSDQNLKSFRTFVKSKYNEIFTEISLLPLSETSAIQLVSQLLSLPELPEKLKKVILSKADGNPFFVEEIIRSLIERGILIQDKSGEGWIATPLIESVTVPNTLQGVLMSRLDRLPDETKWLVQQASVIGRVFLYRVLLQIAENTVGIEAELSHLEREELIREKARNPEIEYIFKHALTQEVAYQSLLSPRRKELHRKVGCAIEVVFAERINEFHTILGKHFWLGEDWEKAAEYLIKAGDDAARLYAFVEARLHYGDALDALAKLSDTMDNCRLRIDTIIKLCSVSYYADNWEQMIARLNLAETFLQKLPNPLQSSDRLRQGRVHYWMGWAYCHLQNQMGNGNDYLQKALATAQEERDEELLAVCSTIIGLTFLAQGRFSKAETLILSALTPLEKANSHSDLIHVMGNLSIALAARGKYTQALPIAQRALNCGIQISNPSRISQIYLSFCVVHFLAGEMLQSLCEVHTAIDIAEQFNDLAIIYWLLGFSAWAYSRLGNHSAAIKNMAKAKETAKILGGKLAATDWFAAADAEISLNAGNIEEALTKAQEAVAYAKSIDGIFAEGIAHRVWAEALFKLKLKSQKSKEEEEEIWQEVQSHLSTSLQLFEEGDARLEAARTHIAWGLICRDRNDKEEAIYHLEKAASQFEESELTQELERTRKYIEEINVISCPVEYL